MIWVRREYADALAVVFAWLAALLPWNVTYASAGGGRLLFVRFPLFQVRLAVGFEGNVVDPLVVFDPLSAIAFQAGSPIRLAYQVWAVGALAVALALALSLAIRRQRTPSHEQPVDPVRLMGVLLGAAAALLTAASYLLFTRGFQGPAVPVGVVLLYAFALVLLVVERVDGEDGGSGNDGDGPATGGA